MEQFKLRDIDEFDNDFKNLIDKKEIESFSDNNNVIVKSEENSEIFSGEESVPQIEKDKQKILDNVLSDNSDYSEEMDDDYAEEEISSPKRNHTGLFIIKTVSIILLVVTVIIFVLGCFVSVFLDNNGLSIGGYCFNTQSQTIETLGVKSGDLIISEKADIESLNSNDVICVPSINNDGCDIQVVKNTNSNELNDVIYTYAFENEEIFESAISSYLCYGKVKFYIPYTGRIINFALNNAIIVCILFIAIAALWFLILILVEKRISNLNSKENQ